MGSCQNYGPLLKLGPLHSRCRIILRTYKGDYNFDSHACVAMRRSSPQRRGSEGVQGRLSVFLIVVSFLKRAGHLRLDLGPPMVLKDSP